MNNTFWGIVANTLSVYSAQFIQGSLITLAVALSGTIIGLVIGMIIGVVRVIPINHRDSIFKKVTLNTVNTILTIYVEVFRGTPMIVQAMIIYYGLMEGFGLDMSPFVAGLLVVSVNTGAYMAEIVRGGINSIDKGQFEAAHAIGMSHTQTMFNIIIPQTIKNILPATSNEFVLNIKDTAVLNVISLNELFFASKSIMGKSYQVYPIFIITCTIYFILTFTVTRILRVFEKKLVGSETYKVVNSRKGI